MTHRRSLGSFLREPVPTEPAPAKPLTDTDRVRAALRAEPQRWFSAREIEQAAAVRPSRVNGSVCSLVDCGQVERELSVAAGRRQLGQRYRWVSQ